LSRQRPDLKPDTKAKEQSVDSAEIEASRSTLDNGRVVETARFQFGATTTVARATQSCWWADSRRDILRSISCGRIFVNTA
jgi:hypothetical protein